MKLSDDDLNDKHLIDMLVFEFVASLAAKSLLAKNHPEAVMMTAVDIIAARTISVMEQLTGIDRDILLSKHTEHVAAILEREYARKR